MTTIAGREASAEYYSFSPDYYLNGSADLLYTSDRLDATGTRTDIGSFLQQYTLGLNGPVIGPYIGLFSFNSRLSLNDLSANDRSAEVRGYGFGGNAYMLPMSKSPFSLYFETEKAASDQFGLKSTTDAKNYGLTLNPRFFRGTTFLSYDHGILEGDVGGNHFSETRDRGNLFYQDERRFGKDSRLGYQYQLTALEENRENNGIEQKTTEIANELLVNHYARWGEKTEWRNSLSCDYTDRRRSYDVSQSEIYYSGRYESILSHDYARNLRGYLKLNHLTLKRPWMPVADVNGVEATGIYEEVPNPVPKLHLGLQTSLGVLREWETERQSESASLDATSRWSFFNAFDIINNLSYSYIHASGAVPTGGTVSSVAQGVSGESADALAYQFGLQGKGTAFTWYSFYAYQAQGLLTSPVRAGTSHSVSLGGTAATRNFFNQSYYIFTKTDIPGPDLHSREHRAWSNTTYRITNDLNTQALVDLFDTETSYGGATSGVTTENLSLSVNWNPVPRIAVSGAGSVSHSKGSGGEGLGYRLEGTLNWILRVINLRFLYSYANQDQKTSTGDFNTNEHRLEVEASTSFSFRLGSFFPGAGIGVR